MSTTTNRYDSAIGPQYSVCNETTLDYAPGSHERTALKEELRRQDSSITEIPLIIKGESVETQQRVVVSPPHAHSETLARASQAATKDVHRAIEAAMQAHGEWSRWSLQERSAVFLKAADLLASRYRQIINASTMLGQSKTAHQAEIDSACELVDFLRFNVRFAQDIARQQPISSAGIRNLTDYRPLEGFIYAVTPFNFTAIGGNLATAPALMGNTVIWKPATTAALSNYRIMQVLEEAGLPPGVINFLPGDAETISATVLKHPDFAGLHFTGSTQVFDQLWLETAQNLKNYRNYPRLVGETGGKDFVLAHTSADIETLCTALVRGAFEYQGQKCSAASRAYLPASIWPRLRNLLLEQTAELKVGDVRDFSNFMGAVIDKKAFLRLSQYLDIARASTGVRILQGGDACADDGYFVQPTIVQVDDPHHDLMRHELFGPILTLYIYNDDQWPEILTLVDQTSPYALTGAIFARDRNAISEANTALRFAAGNFYVNDKPTGAVVGQQPFGGARRSGTNDKAGSSMNLLRWVSARTVKETFVPAHDYRYPHMN